MDRRDLDGLRRMRDSLIAQIERDFAGVSREGGVSISEAYAIDDHEPEEVRIAARASDTYSRWQELDVAKEDPAGSAMGFMDPIGTRFHLPAYMCFTLKHGTQALGSYVDTNTQLWSYWLRVDDERASSRFSLLHRPQRQCVARFLVFQAYASEVQSLSSDWLRVLREYWLRDLPDGERRGLQNRWPQLRA